MTIRIIRSIILFLSIVSICLCEKTCDEKTKVCQASAETTTTCNKGTDLCQEVVSTNLFRHSGTAQAYKVNAPLKQSICQDASKYSHKVASWPLYRRSFKAAPTMTLEIRLWSCSTNENDNNSNNCCCQVLTDNHAMVDIWQARPDGTYSSLRRKQDDGDCRARAVVQNHGNSVRLETVAPGSTGIFNGLGPSQWDFAPYGAPVIHILATADNHAPTLVDVPILMDRKTLQPRQFTWKDWRGSGWVHGSRQQSAAVEIVGWKADPKKNHVTLEINVFLTQSTETVSLETAFCPSKLYGLPWAFYTEPIAECAPSMLDFFAL